MAIYEKGVLGPYTGRIGNIIGSKWRSIDYLRSLPRKRRTKRKPSEKQLEQQMKFIMALDFLGPLRLFFNLALKDNQKSGMTNFNAATSALMKMIEGQHPNLVIPYHKVEFSKGQLMNILPSVHNTPEEINITWSNIIASGASGKDTVMIIMYDEVNKDYYVFETLREDCKYQLIVPEFPEGIMHIWTAVLSVDNSQWSNSEYCGKFAFGDL